MQNIYKKYVKSNKNKRKYRIGLIFSIFILCFAFLIFYINFFITPLIVDTTSSQVKVYATKSINYAVTETMNQNIKYDDLIHIQTDNSGKINLIQANSTNINNISMMIERITLTHLLEISRNPLKIPLGAFTGIPLFSGVGPKIYIDIYPYGEVHCEFLSQFVSAGINQTQHKIYVEVVTNINVVLPFNNVSVKMSNEVLVCESVIVGDIPETYLKSNTLTEMLELVPN